MWVSRLINDGIGHTTSKHMKDFGNEILSPISFNIVDESLQEMDDLPGAK
jgi:hypothetical protein